MLNECEKSTMGGGDLNLKKSWHPHTMKNQEKVWKAEQAKLQEDKKLKDLRREIEEEKTREELKQIGRNSGVLPQEDKKLEWMYKSSTDLINRDEYLLGRTIDKSFEMLQAEEQRKTQSNMVGVKQSINHVEHEVIPFSIRAYRNIESKEQVDLQRKVMEDPLMLIKQREMESRKKILENPVKLKELHRILKSEQLLKKSKKTKKSKKSKKKHKKRAKSSSNDDSSDSLSDVGNDLDKELEKRYKRLNKKDFSGLNLSKLLDAKFETITKELDKAAGDRKHKSRRKRSTSTEGIDGYKMSRLKDSKGREEVDSFHDRNRRQQRKSPSSRSPSNKYRRRSRSRSPQTITLPPDERHKGQNVISRSRSPNINEPQKYSRKRSNSPRTTLTNDHERQRETERSPAEPRTRQYSTSPSVEKELRSKAKENESIAKSKKRVDRNAKYTKQTSDRRRRSREHDYSDKQRNHRSRSQSTQKSRNRQKRSSTRSPERRPRKRELSQSPRKCSTSRSPQRHVRSGNRNENERNITQSSSSSTANKTSSNSSKVLQGKFSDAEKEARLREMMENASWREEDRVKSVKKQREANAREEDQYKTQEFDKEFINKEVKKAIATHSSVGSRIRSNLNNIQRTSAAMNSNFTRK
ncbi:pre-mRNA-splicing factor CWC25 homolog [Eurosta solidaginis]|uniref:pre-mRNA-splicing factor CWC25 homolog n=1 Tax=Eurosta solidaginis TaxID=178769 RepID=UPI003530EEC2